MTTYLQSSDIESSHGPYNDQATTSTEPVRDWDSCGSFVTIFPPESGYRTYERKRSPKVKKRRRSKFSDRFDRVARRGVPNSAEGDSSSIFSPNFPENDRFYLQFWWKILVTFLYSMAIYYSTYLAYHQAWNHRNLINITHGCTMAAVIILAKEPDTLTRLLIFDAIAFFSAAVFDLNLEVKNAILLIYCHMLEVTIGVLGYKRWGGKGLEDNPRYAISLHGMIGFWLFVVGLAPAFTALFGAIAFNIILGRPFVEILEQWWPADCLGTYVSFWLINALGSISKREFYSLFLEENRLSTSILMAEILLQIAMIYFIYHPMMPTLNILCLPMLSFIAWRHHIAVSTFLQMYATTLVTLTQSKIADTPTGVETSAFYIILIVTLFVSTLIAVLVTRFHELYADKVAKQKEVLKTLTDVQNLLTETQVFQRMRHEIKTPLHVVQGFSKELEAYPGLQNEPRTFAHHISESSSHILAVLSDLSDFFEVNSTKECEPELVIDLHHLWCTTCEKIVSLGDKCGVEVMYSLHDGVPRFIKGDQHRLVQILLNLASNAIKYTAPVISELSQKGLVTLILQYSAEKKTIRMCVFDTGVGIPAHLQDSVYHTYVRDNEMAERLQVPGTGLGLSIASSLVRKMGGELTFHSAVGLGTDFYVTIPINECTDAPADTYASSFNPVPQNVLRILIVEASDIGRHLLRYMLSRLGQTDVVEAKSRLETVNIVQNMQASESFDIAFFDLASTELTMLFEDIKCLILPCLVGTPIVISAPVNNESWEQLQAMGAKIRLDKPYTLDNIMNIVQLFASPNSKD